MKHITVHETESAFNNVRSSLSKPQLALILETSTIQCFGGPNANGHEYVDLGLPSGTLWATMNVGATGGTLESWYGHYYMWGSTTLGGDANCDWTHAPFNNGSSSYNREYFNAHSSEWLDGTTPSVLKSEYDIAHLSMGGDWHMPTLMQLKELDKETEHHWVANYNGINGLNGQLFTSKVNGNKLFIPAAGCRDESYLDDDGLCCYLWSSSLNVNDPDNAWRLYFDDDRDFRSSDTFYRFFGHSVRGVL